MSGEGRIAVIGAGWWSQGWHLPHLDRNDGAKIVAIVDVSPNPKSSLNPRLESLAALSDKYKVPTFDSVENLLKDADVGPHLDGVIVATPHSTHFAIGRVLLEEASQRHQQGKLPLHIFMEKPMTTDVSQAHAIYQLVREYQEMGGKGYFFVNHSANYRRQAMKAREIVTEGSLIGEIRHVSAFFASPLMSIFDNPTNKGWNEPSEGMLGNGFGWGQATHLLGWIHQICPTLSPEKVFCAMNYSDATGADVSHAAAIICHDSKGDKEKEVVMSVSGTTLLPGVGHSTGKQVQIRIFGSKGAITYCGDDCVRESGRLDLSTFDSNEVQHPCGNGFDFENVDAAGTGPESLRNFIRACRGEDVFVGADALVGLRTVQVLDAMYRSNVSRQCEQVLFANAK